MTRTVLAAALALSLATPALAGNVAPAPTEPVVVTPEPAPADQSWVIPLLAIILFAGGLNNS